MIEKIENNLIRDIQEAASHPTGSPRQEAADKADASLEVQFASLLEQARQAPQDDADAVQRARDLLITRQLDTPDNLRQAADNILTFGL